MKKKIIIIINEKRYLNAQWKWQQSGYTEWQDPVTLDFFLHEESEDSFSVALVPKSVGDSSDEIRTQQRIVVRYDFEPDELEPLNAEGKIKKKPQ